MRSRNKSTILMQRRGPPQHTRSEERLQSEAHCDDAVIQLLQRLKLANHIDLVLFEACLMGHMADWQTGPCSSRKALALIASIREEVPQTCYGRAGGFADCGGGSWRSAPARAARGSSPEILVL